MNDQWYVILADVGTDWPEVFGPFNNWDRTSELFDSLLHNTRIHGACVQVIIRPAEYLGGDWDRAFDEATE